MSGSVVFWVLVVIFAPLVIGTGLAMLLIVGGVYEELRKRRREEDRLREYDSRS